MIGYVILGLVVVFLAVILIRAAMFRPKAQPTIQPQEVYLNRQKVVDALAELIKCKTIS